jgi:hypothetical protein
MSLRLLLLDQCVGANDIGVYAFLTDSLVPGKVLTDYTSCVYSALDAIYDSDGRYFVLLNVAPLYFAPLYANYTVHGSGRTTTGLTYLPIRRRLQTSCTSTSPRSIAYMLLLICLGKQIDRIIVKKFVDVLGGTSKYATYYSS